MKKALRGFPWVKQGISLINLALFTLLVGLIFAFILAWTNGVDSLSDVLRLESLSWTIADHFKITMLHVVILMIIVGKLLCLNSPNDRTLIVACLFLDLVGWMVVSVPIFLFYLYRLAIRLNLARSKTATLISSSLTATTLFLACWLALQNEIMAYTWYVDYLVLGMFLGAAVTHISCLYTLSRFRTELRLIDTESSSESDTIGRLS